MTYIKQYIEFNLIIFLYLFNNLIKHILNIFLLFEF